MFENTAREHGAINFFQSLPAPRRGLRTRQDDTGAVIIRRTQLESRRGSYHAVLWRERVHACAYPVVCFDAIGVFFEMPFVWRSRELENQS